MSRIERKKEHIHFALEQQHSNSAGFDDIHFIHQSLPNISIEDVRLEHPIGELSLGSPIFINAMTGGGGDQTYQINKDLATAARMTGLAMAVGSQMSSIKNPEQRYTYEIVRKENPTGIIIANIGSTATPEEAAMAVEMIDADALQIHINVVQELTMPEGDRDFTNVLTNIETILKAVKVPVIVKEVGFGMSRETVIALKKLGISIVDVGGFGGTNFAKIENNRRKQSLSFFNQWGIPTAISIMEARNVSPDLFVIGSGGVQSSLDIAKGIAAGADAIGIAGIFLKTLLEQGLDALLQKIETLQQELMVIMTALGARTISDLKRAPLIISGKSSHWLKERGIDTTVYSRRIIR